MRELIIILLVVLLVFGAKKLRTIGSDLGAAVRGFKKGLDEGETEESLKQIKQDRADADQDALAEGLDRLGDDRLSLGLTRYGEAMAGGRSVDPQPPDPAQSGLML
jgi:sec-independent protein translocase protein TatA